MSFGNLNPNVHVLSEFHIGVSRCCISLFVFLSVQCNLAVFCLILFGLKEHVALDRSSCKSKAFVTIFNKMQKVKRCCKSRIQWSTQTRLEIAQFSFYLDEWQWLTVLVRKVKGKPSNLEANLCMHHCTLLLKHLSTICIL